jgi:hypothetical protein
MTDGVERLRRARRLDTEDAIREFEEALAALPDTLDAQTLDDLHMVFDDDTMDPGVMFDLVHRLERTPTGAQEASLLRVLPRLMETAPEWAETLVMRILNNEAARMTLIGQADEAPQAQRAALRIVLEGIGGEDDAVGQRARATLDELDAHAGSSR